MATRRMRIKAVINVSRGGANKGEGSSSLAQEQLQSPAAILPPTTPTSSSLDNVPLSPAPVPSPRICSGPVSPAPTGFGGSTSILDSGGGGGDFQPPSSPGIPPPRVGTPTPIGQQQPPSSPHSPSPSTSSSWQLQRPSPSKSPACLPPSGSLLRRSPSPALSRLTNSPGPPLSPVKSPVPSYASPLSPVKHISRSRTPGFGLPIPSTSFPLPLDPGYPTTMSPGLASVDSNVKSPNSYVFRPPPSPSQLGHHDFLSIKSPSSVSRPSPAQSPVFGSSRPVSNSPASLTFLSHHLNSNSNSADSHEVAALMSASANNASSYPSSPSVSGLFPQSPEKRISGRDSGSENSFPVFSNVSNNLNPSSSPSFSKTIFDNPEPLKRRAEDTRKKEAAQANATKFASARKEFFDKLQSGQLPERNKMTILHFTFYNPPNPNKLKAGDRKSRSRASSICSDVSTISISKQEPDLNENETPPVNNENMGKALSAPSSIAGSRRTTASSIGSGGSIPVSEGGQSEASVASNASSNASLPGPRVKVGPDGQLIIDEKSLVVETSESQRARQQIEDMEVVSGAEYAVGSSGFYRYKKSYRRGTDWTERETVRFYRALNQCGTDFSMMQKLFPYRSRQELKSKFKREDRKNPDLISKVLQSCVFDPDEGISSDEDPDKNPGAGKDGEVVVCSSEDAATVGPPGSKKKKIKKEKKKDMEFSAEQIQEMNANLRKGPGTGKGRQWNTPVEGLVGNKLPPPPPKPVTIKVEKNQQPSLTTADSATNVVTKPKKKYTRKKKQPVEEGSDVAKSAGAFSISQPLRPPPGTVSIIMATGVLPTPSSSSETSTLAGVKKEKADASNSTTSVGKIKSENLQNPTQKTAISTSDSTVSKRRSRVPKKPNVNVKGAGRGNTGQRKGSTDTQTNLEGAVEKSSQPFTKGLCDDFFKLCDNDNDPTGLKDVPAPLVPVEETVLEGNEEGREDLVVVDLDELNSIQSDMAKELQRPSAPVPVPSAPAGGKRKRKKSTSEVKLVAARRDPYGIPDDKGVGPSTSQSPFVSEPANKKVKPLPYRVPGPGGTQPTSESPPSLELVLEINLSES